MGGSLRRQLGPRSSATPQSPLFALLSRSGLCYCCTTQINLADNYRPNVKEPRGILPSWPNIAPPSKEPSTGSEFASHETHGDSSSKPTQSDKPIEKAPGGNSDEPLAASQGTTETLEPVHLGKEQTAGHLGRSFHVFTWLNEAQSTAVTTPHRSLSPDIQSGGVDADPPFVLDEMSLRADLKEMDRFLKRETSFEERLIYSQCPQSTRQQIYTMLMNEGRTITALTRKDRSRAKIYEDKVEVFNKAEALFRLFLPSNFEGRIVEKYWGAVNRLLVVSYTPSYARPRVNTISKGRTFLHYSYASGYPALISI